MLNLVEALVIDIDKESCVETTMDRWQHSGPPSKLRRFYEKHSSHVLTSRGLRQQSRLYQGTGGASADNRDAGFIPAFLDRTNNKTYPSVFADGRAAPVHVLDGLPESVIVRRSRAGKVTAVKGCIIAGFLLADRFYTREQAVEYLANSEESRDTEPKRALN